jgi:ABC-type nitrate/sulfonate/bicarbonate transport system ATPase subunit
MEQPETSTDLIRTAVQLASPTHRHIFLTGRAGTGKTTFLRAIAAATRKRHIIVALTGIAALNAKVVTIHSQFLLPPGTFLPNRMPASREYSEVRRASLAKRIARV